MFDGLKSELRRPTTAIALIIAAVGIVASILVSLYFYYKSVKEGKISYQIEQFQVFNQSSFGEEPIALPHHLYVVDEAGNRIDNNIYAARIKVRNSGNGEIRREDVRIPFKLKTSGTAFVVSRELETTTGQYIDRFSLSNNGSLDWAHFDPGEGFAISVVYAAKKYEQIDLEGYAANTASPSNVEANRNTNENVILKYILWTASIVVVCAMMILVGRTASAPKDERLKVLRAGFSFLLPFFAMIFFQIAIFGPFLELLLRKWLTLNPPF